MGESDSSTMPHGMESLRLAAQQFEALLARSNSLFSIVDGRDGSFLYVSPTAERLLGYTPEEMMHMKLKSTLEDVHPDDRERVRAFIAEQKADTTGELRWRPCRFRKRRKDGTYAQVEASSACRDGLLYGVMHDASAEAQSELMLRDLLASSSFDLRIGATNVQAAANLLAQRRSVNGDPEADWLAKSILQSVNILFDLVANVLEMRKPEKGQIDMQYSAFNLREALSDVLTTCRISRLSSSTSEVVWINEGEQQLPTEVWADKGHISQVVLNLTTNAIKFGRGKAVDVSVNVEPEPAAEPAVLAASLASHSGTCNWRLLRVDVTDRGQGVPADMRDRIFEPFVKSSAEQGGGVGMGLHVCRSLSRAMGGDVTLDSHMGTGSTFSLRVPVCLLGDSADQLPPVRVTTATVAPSAGVRPEVESTAMPSTAALPPRHMRQPSSGITDHQSAEMLNDLMVEMLSHSQELFCILRRGGDGGLEMTWVSPSASHLLGWQSEEMVGKACIQFIHPADQAAHLFSVSALLGDDDSSSSGASRSFRRILRKDGGWTWMHALTIKSGPCLLKVLRDATMHQEAQAALKTFLLTTSHDLRTPCHSIQSATELLAKRPAVQNDKEAQFLITAIMNSVETMLCTVRNVLDLQAMDTAITEHGAPDPKLQIRLDLKNENFFLRELLVSTVQTSSVALGKSPDAVRLTMSPLVPALAEGDAGRLRHMVMNMLCYVLRSGRDDVKMSIIWEPVACDASSSAHAQGSRGMLVITFPHVAGVVDEEHVFSPMTMTDAQLPTGRSFYSMFVTRACARAMGGDITVRPGTGGNGTLELRVQLESGTEAEIQRGVASPTSSDASDSPLQRLAVVSATHASFDISGARQEALSQPQEQHPPGSPAGARPLCMLVDDHALNLKLVKRLLESNNFDVVTAENGLDALSQLTAALEGRPGASARPDIVLCDLNMPVMGGVEFVRHFRSWEHSHGGSGGAHLPIIALTANVDASQVQACTDAGFDAHVSKPLRPATLQELRRHITPRAQRGHPTAAE